MHILESMIYRRGGWPSTPLIDRLVIVYYPNLKILQEFLTDVLKISLDFLFWAILGEIDSYQ